MPTERIEPDRAGIAAERAHRGDRPCATTASGAQPVGSRTRATIAPVGVDRDRIRLGAADVHPDPHRPASLREAAGRAARIIPSPPRRRDRSVIRPCTMRKKTMTGIAMSVEPAMIAAQFVPPFGIQEGAQPHRQGHHLGTRVEDEREDELVPGLDEPEHPGGDEARARAAGT